MSNTELIQQRLKEARKVAKLTQVQAAEKLAIDDSTIAKWETAKSVPSLKLLFKIAQIYGCSVGYLTGEGGNTYDACGNAGK